MIIPDSTATLRPAPEPPVYVIERCRCEPGVPGILLAEEEIARTRDFDDAVRRARDLRARHPLPRGAGMTRTGYCTRLRAAGLTVTPVRQATTEGSDRIDLTAYRLTDRAGTHIADIMLLDDAGGVRAFVETHETPEFVGKRLGVERLYRALSEAGI